ncbi:hypothetical protein A5873_001259, partial [Enterococcus faecium]
TFMMNANDRITFKVTKLRIEIRIIIRSIMD